MKNILFGILIFVLLFGVVSASGGAAAEYSINQIQEWCFRAGEYPIHFVTDYDGDSGHSLSCDDVFDEDCVGGSSDRNDITCCDNPNDCVDSEGNCQDGTHESSTNNNCNDGIDNDCDSIMDQDEPACTAS